MTDEISESLAQAIAGVLLRLSKLEAELSEVNRRLTAHETRLQALEREADRKRLPSDEARNAQDAIDTICQPPRREADARRKA